MALTGTLDSFQLGSLLQLLSGDQKSGVLRIRDKDREANIFMKDGIIVYASSPKKELQLGRILRSQGVLSESALNKCLKLSKSKNQKLGKTMIQEGYISLEQLKQVLHHQVKEILFSLFFWKAGRFEFEEKKLSVNGKLVTKMNTLEIVLEASRRIDEWSLIESEITSDTLIFRISEKSQEKSEVKFNKDEWRILSMIDGNRTVRQVVDGSQCDEFTAFKSICSLHLSGFIEITEDTKTRKVADEIDYPTIVNIYNDVFQVIMQGMETELGQSVHATFDSCKGQLLPDQQTIFHQFNMKNGLAENTRSVLNAMEKFQDEEKGHSFLIHSFTTLLQLLLQKETAALGFHLTKKTLDEISQTLSYIRDYHKKTPEMERILGAIKTVIEEVGVNAGNKKNKHSGLLGSLKGKK